MDVKRCKRCQGLFEGLEVEAFFRVTKSGDRSIATQRRAICGGCELTARTERKKANRPREKARRALSHHADKYIRLGQAKSREDFAQRYGWDPDHMAHDIEHTALNGCCYCRRPFSEMEHGLADVSLDVIDPSAPPYYRTNCRWCCRTCNTEKARTPPHLWGAKLRAWEKWRIQHQSEYPLDSLFGDWDAA